MPGGPRRLQLAPGAYLGSLRLGSRLVDQLEAEVAARLAA